MKEIILSGKDIQRFWSKVDIRGEDECWEWQAARDEDGYGIFAKTHRMSLKSHRISLTLALGRQIKEGMGALHSCDNPACCNPNHLWEGTPAENNQDMIQKGRLSTAVAEWRKAHLESFLVGEKHPNARLKESDVVEIRRLYATGDFTQQQIADRYETTQSHVKDIINGRRWKHIPLSQ